MLRLLVFVLTISAVQPFAHAASLEEKIVEEMSLARTNPKQYAAFIRDFRTRFQGKHYTLPELKNTRIMTNEGVSAVDEAIRFLERQKPVGPLSWSKGLAKAADDLAEEQGETGTTGHVGEKSGDMKTRIERHGRWETTIGENISYGPDEARMVVMQLIIDDGVKSRGHRKNIFNPAFKVAGVACGPHPRIRTVCVTDFAGGFSE